MVFRHRASNLLRASRSNQWSYRPDCYQPGVEICQLRRSSRALNSLISFDRLKSQGFSLPGLECTCCSMLARPLTPRAFCNSSLLFLGECRGDRGFVPRWLPKVDDLLSCLLTVRLSVSLSRSSVLSSLGLRCGVCSFGVRLPHPSPPAKMSSMHLSAGSSPACAAQDAASVRLYISWILPSSRVFFDIEGMWPRSSGSPCSAVMIPAIPPKTAAVLNEGLCRLACSSWKVSSRVTHQAKFRSPSSCFIRMQISTRISEYLPSSKVIYL